MLLLEEEFIVKRNLLVDSLGHFTDHSRLGKRPISQSGNTSRLKNSDISQSGKNFSIRNEKKLKIMFVQ